MLIFSANEWGIVEKNADRNILLVVQKNVNVKFSTGRRLGIIIYQRCVHFQKIGFFPELFLLPN
jgi:hypothetical protein